MGTIRVLGAMAGLYASAACAQSSVTLYGVLDEGLIFNDNAGGHRQFAMLAGVLSGNRFGLQGTEDLGGGLHTVFTLENGFDLNSGALGQGGRLFGRQAWVGLSGDHWGTVTFGRQYDSSVDFVGPYAAPALWGGYIATNPGDNEDYSAANHLNNSIKFKSAKIGGLTFGGVYSIGGIAGDVTQNQIYSMGANYEGGWISLAGSYLNARNPNASLYATSRPNATAATNNFYTPINSGFASAHTLQMADVAATVSLGSVKLGANYSHTQFRGLDGKVSVLNPAGLSGGAAMNSVAANIRYQLTPALLVASQASYTHGSAVLGQAGGKYGQFDLGAVYSLSKRTSFYGTAIYQIASGRQSTGTPAVASIFGITPSSSNRQLALRLAIRQVF
ncbi:porin [Caballeronia sp. LP003]|uniref:porin n=1 Tax=Caballeronia sp. LP003 TaxID=3038551 RepID=UPI0028542D79|nr:porin [Caballeronia sp. LP003]MDR5785503.1 porin [Caballeronia sp. LP003]